MEWICLARSFSRNFSNKTECFKCKEEKGEAVDYEMPPREPRKEDDGTGVEIRWICNDCNYTNFPNKL